MTDAISDVLRLYDERRIVAVDEEAAKALEWLRSSAVEVERVSSRAESNVTIDPEEVRYALSQAMEYNPISGRDFDSIGRILAGWFVPAKSWDDRAGVWLVEFKDGARFAMFGGHDSTGWDCRSTLDLCPFEAWEAQLAEDYSEYSYPAPLTEIIASIKAQLASAPEKEQ